MREFVTAYANEFVAERESALDLGSRLGRQVRGRFRVEVSSEVLEVAERRDFRRARSGRRIGIRGRCAGCGVARFLSV